MYIYIVYNLVTQIVANKDFILYKIFKTLNISINNFFARGFNISFNYIKEILEKNVTVNSRGKVVCCDPCNRFVTMSFTLVFIYAVF